MVGVEIESLLEACGLGALFAFGVGAKIFGGMMLTKRRSSNFADEKTVRTNTGTHIHSFFRVNAHQQRAPGRDVRCDSDHVRNFEIRARVQ
jgi:hypothetical protein